MNQHLTGTGINNLSFMKRRLNDISSLRGKLEYLGGMASNPAKPENKIAQQVGY
jgi:hypothetical protein